MGRSERRDSVQAASLVILVAAWCVALPAHAFSGEWRAGGGLGFGGAGLKQVTTVNGADTEVNRSESPGAFHFFVDRVVDRKWTIGVEHLRGFALAPISSGTQFTGVTARWFFLGGPMVVGAVDTRASYLIIRRFTPFLGGGAGVVTADITREKDLADRVTGSAVYMGLRLGADYPMMAQWGARAQLSASGSLVQDPVKPTQLSELALTGGLFYVF